MKYMVGRCIASWLALLCFASPLLAQAGALTGRVTSAETAAPIASASVDVRTETGQVLTGTLSNAEGVYRIANVAPGTYTVVARSIGFRAATNENVTVSAGETVNLSFQLAPGAVELNPIVVSASRRVERALDAPARVEVVGMQAVDQRPATTPVEHVRGVPGVDIITTGVQSTNVVARGFNNIFSGALMALTDHRIAGIPSLRVNLLHMVPIANEDIERVEVVLGPGAALYGPNTANGVLHMFTRSPLSHTGTTLSVSGGERSALQPSFRTAHRIGENFGIKLSGEYFRAEEWEHRDATEQAERAFADANPQFWMGRVIAAEGISEQEAQQRFQRVAARDETVERLSGELRADWRVTPDLTTVFSVGSSNSMSGVELTGLGAGQVQDWRYTYYQARANWNRLFGQVYLNTSNAGDTYLLRNGSPIVDESRLLVAQLQHGASLGERQNFTYGADFIHTDPRTAGTVHGRHEDDDNITEVGAYLQSETALSPQFDLVLAGRVDHHSHLPDPVFSPRAALVFKPAENHSVRLTYNSAFSTPTSVNLFLDLGTPFPAEAAVLSQLGYSVRVQGTVDGIRVRQPDGNWLIRSPIPHPVYNPTPGSLIPPNSSFMWQQAVGVMQQMGMDAQTAQFLFLNTPEPGAVGLNAWNVATGQTVALGALDIPDLPQIRETNVRTFELGYKGVLANRLLLAADAWYQQMDNFVTPLLVQTPFLLLNGPDIVQHLAPRFMATGMSQEQAVATATAIATQMAQLPLGVVSSEDVHAQGAQALMSYRNFGDIDMWGSDISARFLLTDQLSLSATASLVNRDHFFSEGQLITLNAPKQKGSVALNYSPVGPGFSGEARVRHTAGFPAASGVYFGTDCIPDAPDALAGACVDSYTLADLTVGYRLRGIRAPSVQFTVQNLFDTAYQSFPGVPTIGRMALLRLRYDF